MFDKLKTRNRGRKYQNQNKYRNDNRKRVVQKDSKSRKETTRKEKLD